MVSNYRVRTATQVFTLYRGHNWTMTGASWHIRNEKIHRDLITPLLRDEFRKIRVKHTKKLIDHPNPFASLLAKTNTQSRIRRANFPPDVSCPS